VFVFENYCRIHDKVDLSVLATKLAMDQEAAEHWIVDLIRNALLDAKIDSEQGGVVMGPGADDQSVYEKVMGKTRDLNLRSASLAHLKRRSFLRDWMIIAKMSPVSTRMCLLNAMMWLAMKVMIRKQDTAQSKNELVS